MRIVARRSTRARRRRRRVIRSRDLGIALRSRDEGELFKWFLACLLFGKPIQQEVACRGYLELARAGLLTPEAILRAGWDRLVAVLDRGHYVRYDFSTATKLLEVCRTLRARHGTLTRLFAEAMSEAEVRRRLEAFKGVGPTTVRIFLRDVRPFFHPGRRARRRRPP
jgi:endonuclease III